MPPSDTQELHDLHLHELRGRVDRALEEGLQFQAGCPERLQQAIRYAVLGGGKRLRPLLALLACEACGGPADAALPAACAVEFVHAYSLVHDDLPAMDNDDLRRGQPTCHIAFDEATAILVGDALLARAFEILAEGIKGAESAARSCALLARAAGAEQLVGGQADDLDGNASGSSLERLQAIHRRKTGAMIQVSLALGGIAAGASDDQLALLAQYGQNFGLAFQITDDLLDARGDAKRVGKRVGKDADRGKLTYPYLVGIEESEGEARRCVEQACAALQPFGPAAAPLEQLALSLLDRQN